MFQCSLVLSCPNWFSTSAINGSHASHKVRSCRTRSNAFAASGKASHQLRVFARRGLTLWGSQVVTLQDSMEAIACLRPLLDESFAMGEKSRSSRTGSGGTQTEGMRLAERLRASLIVSRASVLTRAALINFTERRMSHCHTPNPRLELIIQ